MLYCALCTVKWCIPLQDLICLNRMHGIPSMKPTVCEYIRPSDMFTTQEDHQALCYEDEASVCFAEPPPLIFLLRGENMFGESPPPPLPLE